MRMEKSAPDPIIVKLTNFRNKKTCSRKKFNVDWKELNENDACKIIISISTLPLKNSSDAETITVSFLPSISFPLIFHPSFLLINTTLQSSNHPFPTFFRSFQPRMQNNLTFSFKKQYCTLKAWKKSKSCHLARAIGNLSSSDHGGKAVKNVVGSGVGWESNGWEWKGVEKERGTRFER